MRKIVTIQIGAGGLEIGNQFWETCRLEHVLSSTGVYHGSMDIREKHLENIGACFDETDDSYIPRTVLIDSLDGIYDNWLPIMPHCNAIKTKRDLFAFTEGFFQNSMEQYVEKLLDVMSMIMEACDDPITFAQVIHSTTCGIGSGLCAAFQQELTDQNHKLSVNNWTMLPPINDETDYGKFQIYNTILSIPMLLQHSNVSVILDSQSVNRIAKSNRIKLQNQQQKKQQLQQHQPMITGSAAASDDFISSQLINYDDQRVIASLPISNYTSIFRFPAKKNADYEQRCINMMPFPKLHFLTASVSPINSLITLASPISTQSVMSALFHRNNFLSNIDNGQFLASTTIYRGLGSTDLIKNCLRQCHKQLLNRQLTCSEFAIAACDMAPHGSRCGAVQLANHSGVSGVLNKYLQKYRAHWKRGQLVQYYDGFEESDFDYADKATESVILNYEFAGKWHGQAAAVLAPAGGTFQQF